MKITPRILHRTTKDGSPGWEFILPSLVLISLIGLPVVALIWRSLNVEIFSYAVSESAVNALKLSLITSVICVMVSLVTGTP